MKQVSKHAGTEWLAFLESRSKLALKDMGYDLHITRRDDWWEEGENISESEWRSLVESDATLTLVGSVSAATPNGSTISYNNPLLAEWRHEGSSIPFDYRSGRVVVKNPDGGILIKMIEIAEILDAKVVGDEGEIYTKTDTRGVAIKGVPITAPAVATQQTGRGCLGMLAALILIVFPAFLAPETPGAPQTADSTAFSRESP